MHSSRTPAKTVRTFPDLDALSRAAARDLIAHVERVLQKQDRYTLALAGGSTPRRLYELLASGEEGTLPWSRIHLFWGDERFVPHEHPKSNVRMVKDSLLDHIPIPEPNVHPIPTELDRPETAAAAYTETLRRHFPDRSHTFDTALLGLGEDGHTASLFPGSPPNADEANDGWVRVVTAPAGYDVSTRLTCTASVLNGAARTLFLVAGKNKQNALSAVLDNDQTLPGAQIRPREAVVWFVDRKARPKKAA